MKIGDILVFTGNHTGVLHYDNFIIGKPYKIKDITIVKYGLDEYYFEDNSKAIIFEEGNYGTYLSEVDKYFVTIDEYRDKKIDEII
jgi:hypothetical protein